MSVCKDKVLKEKEKIVKERDRKEGKRVNLSFFSLGRKTGGKGSLRQ